MPRFASAGSDSHPSKLDETASEHYAGDGDGYRASIAVTSYSRTFSFLGVLNESSKSALACKSRCAVVLSLTVHVVNIFRHESAALGRHVVRVAANHAGPN